MLAAILIQFHTSLENFPTIPYFLEKAPPLGHFIKYMSKHPIE